MKIQLSDGKVYNAHFRHFKTTEQHPEAIKHPGHFDDKRTIEVWNTSCYIHEGKCPENDRPCGAPMDHVGETRCSPSDNFDPRNGRKIAFTRAISTYPKVLRAKLWVEYLNINPPKETITAIRRENKELRLLFEMPHSRVEAATKKWQEATGNKDVLPDLGELIDWLMGQAKAA